MKGVVDRVREVLVHHTDARQVQEEIRCRREDGRRDEASSQLLFRFACDAPWFSQETAFDVHPLEPPSLFDALSASHRDGSTADAMVSGAMGWEPVESLRSSLGFYALVGVLVLHHPAYTAAPLASAVLRKVRSEDQPHAPGAQLRIVVGNATPAALATTLLTKLDGERATHDEPSRFARSILQHAIYERNGRSGSKTVLRWEDASAVVCNLRGPKGASEAHECQKLVCGLVANGVLECPDTSHMEAASLGLSSVCEWCMRPCDQLRSLERGSCPPKSIEAYLVDGDFWKGVAATPGGDAGESVLTLACVHLSMACTLMVVLPVDVASYGHATTDQPDRNAPTLLASRRTSSASKEWADKTLFYVKSGVEASREAQNDANSSTSTSWTSGMPLASLCVAVGGHTAEEEVDAEKLLPTDLLVHTSQGLASSAASVSHLTLADKNRTPVTTSWSELRGLVLSKKAVYVVGRYAGGASLFKSLLCDRPNKIRIDFLDVDVFATKKRGRQESEAQDRLHFDLMLVRPAAEEAARRHRQQCRRRRMQLEQLMSIVARSSLLPVEERSHSALRGIVDALSTENVDQLVPPELASLDYHTARGWAKSVLVSLRGATEPRS